MKGQNHPQKGSQIRVEPIKELKAIKTIKKLLADHPRNYCVFTLGINTALRANELLSLTAGKVRHLKIGDDLEIMQSKTGKIRRITINRIAAEAIKNLLKSRNYEEDDPIFLGQRGLMTVSYLNRLVKSWCKTLNLKGNYGSHTLRKTFGYHQRVSHGVALPILVEVFGHSTQRQTLDYLCVQEEEIKSVYMNEI